jgi:SAM-dependent methyltransferase
MSQLDETQLYYQLNRAETVRWSVEHAMDIHLLMTHQARVKLVATRLPKAKVIVDLGAAAGSIYAMGYPHVFEKLIAVDLPPNDRIEMYHNLEMSEIVTPNGPIQPLLRTMSDLEPITTASVDLVWSGQSIEHITEEEAEKVYGEVQRILRPGGHFCLDTPNRLLTEIHIGTSDWIHPEHKIEYYPEHLQRNLRNAGFTIVDQLGLVEMINTRRQGRIDYRDFYASSGVSSKLEDCYIQYYDCVVSPI